MVQPDQNDVSAPGALPPEIVPRPALALWMWLRGLKPKDGQEPLGVQTEQVRRYCLPFGDALRVVPPAPVMQRIFDWTGGEIDPASFYPPTLRRPVLEDVSDYPGLPDARP